MSKKRSGKTTTPLTPIRVKLTLPLAVATTLPSQVRAVKPEPYAPAVSRTVPLRSVKGPLVKKHITVWVPKHMPQKKQGYAMYREGGIRIYGKRQTQRLLEKEYNRERRDERKSNRKRYSHGQAASLRSDPFRIVSTAIRRKLSPRAVDDAALVSRALTRGY